MKPFRFTPEEFRTVPGMLGRSTTCEFVAEYCNQKLDAHLSTLTRVYGSMDKTALKLSDTEQWNWSNKMKQTMFDTHSALLWDVTEIKARECAHVAECISYNYPKSPNEGGTVYAICKLCSQKLTPTWKVSEG